MNNRQRWQEGHLHAISFRCREPMSGAGAMGEFEGLCALFPARLAPALLQNTPIATSACRTLPCSADEVAHLVLALFEDTDLRRDFLRSLEEDTLL